MSSKLIEQLLSAALEISHGMLHLQAISCNNEIVIVLK